MGPFLSRTWWRIALLALPLLFLPMRAEATLEQVRVGLMSLEAPPGYQRTLQALAIETDSILPHLEGDLGLRPGARFRMLLIPAGAAGDSELDHLDQEAPWWAAGYTIPERRLCAIR